MGKNDQPRTGDGRTGGQKPQRAQVTAKTPTGTVLWKQTAGMFSTKPKPAKAAKAAPAEYKPPKRHRWFG